MTAPNPAPEPLTPAWWMIEVRRIREALTLLGIELAPCLPGEEQECGEPLPAHYASELALLMAKAQVLIEVNTPELADAALHIFKVEYETQLREFTEGTHLDPRR